MRIKVCGLGLETQIRALQEMNFDFAGFIFYKKSPRYVLNFLELKNLKKFNEIKKVGVFVNENPEEITKICEAAQLDLVQLHGNESLEEVEQLNSILPIIKVIHMRGEKEEIQAKIDEYEKAASFLLFETPSQDYGGSGKTFDWAMIDALNFSKPYFLSGGLSLENIENFKGLKKIPYALDVNSQFEISPGCKNLNLLKKLKNK